ncbi:Protein of unknown function [Gryllus bimaculatus]|nr:Protein of unknown function [Gryllus bimaculatus]
MMKTNSEHTCEVAYVFQYNTKINLVKSLVSVWFREEEFRLHTYLKITRITHRQVKRLRRDYGLHVAHKGFEMPPTPNTPLYTLMSYSSTDKHQRSKTSEFDSLKCNWRMRKQIVSAIRADLIHGGDDTRAKQRSGSVQRCACAHPVLLGAPRTRKGGQARGGLDATTRPATPPRQRVTPPRPASATNRGEHAQRQRPRWQRRIRNQHNLILKYLWILNHIVVDGSQPPL